MSTLKTYYFQLKSTTRIRLKKKTDRIDQIHIDLTCYTSNGYCNITELIVVLFFLIRIGS